MAFQVDFTEQVKEGLVLGTVADVIVEAMLLFLGSFFKKLFKLNAVEQCSVIYSNAGNLIIPLVVALLAGFVLWLTGWHFPGPVNDAIEA